MKRRKESNRNHTNSLTTRIIVATLATAPSHVDADAEREMLDRISHEIETLEPLIHTAEYHASPDAQSVFTMTGRIKMWSASGLDSGTRRCPAGRTTHRTTVER